MCMFSPEMSAFLYVSFRQNNKFEVSNTHLKKHILLGRCFTMGKFQWKRST